MMLATENDLKRRCVACGRVYMCNSIPLWAFDQRGRLVGTIHKTCLGRPGVRDGYLGNTLPAEDDPDEARLHTWAWSVHPRPDYESDEYYGLMLLRTAGDTLSTRESDQLRWWTDGPLKLGRERGERILAARAALVREYRAWRAGIDDAEQIAEHLSDSGRV